jgi:lipopolysaccharide transport system permease protein
MQLMRYRQFIWGRALADVRHRYAGTGFGVFWNVFQPLVLIGMYAIVFSNIMGSQLKEVPGRFGYTLFLCSGLLPWIAFSDCVMRGSNAFVTNATYLKKLNVPEQIFVAETAVASGISLVISFGLLIIAAVLLGYAPTVYWLILPVPLMALLTFGFGVGLLSGTLNIFFKDIAQFLGIILQFLMWSIPIVYAPQTLGEGTALRSLWRWHPLYPPFEAVRDLFLFSRVPDVEVWIKLLIWPLISCLLSFFALSRLRREIRDVI